MTKLKECIAQFLRRNWPAYFCDCCIASTVGAGVLETREALAEAGVFGCLTVEWGTCSGCEWMKAVLYGFGGS